VLLTSWNWLLLSDLAPYKPVYIDLENPADFTYYFDTCGRRRCYLAPERFVQGKAAVSRRAQDLHVTSAMDVFATGCTVAEVITQEALFQYSDMASFVNTGTFSAATEVQLILSLTVFWLLLSNKLLLLAFLLFCLLLSPLCVHHGRTASMIVSFCEFSSITASDKAPKAVELSVYAAYFSTFF
jgi:hypothetical protein